MKAIIKLVRPCPPFFLATTLFAFSVRSVQSFSSPSATSAPRFVSSASPRFDDFSEKVIGDWQWEKEDSVVVENVQEVMRSCGGAVQGIREIPSFSSNSDEDGYYLNRANDGFVYFDKDGSYSCGPVKCNEAGSETWITSLFFGKLAKSRVLIRKDDANTETFKSLQVIKMSVGEPFATPEDETTLQRLPDNISWEEIVRCRMPSPTQPWMMQRLKWEKSILEDDNQLEEGGDLGLIKCWACGVTVEEEPKLGRLLIGDTSDSVVWSAGGVCTATGLVKSILRQYNGADGSLQSVAWVQGRIRQKDDS